MTFIGNCALNKRKAHRSQRYRVEFRHLLGRAEGAGVVLAGLQPRLDAVFVDSVEAAQWVAALAIHQVLAYQTEFTPPPGVASSCWSVHGWKWSLDWVMGQWPADGSRRSLSSCQQEPDLLSGFVDGHAC